MCKKGYSLTEMIVVVMLLGIFAAIAVPRFNFAIIRKQGVDATAQKLVTDLRRTRALSISDAANDVQYKIRMTGTSPYTGYEIVNDDTGVVVDSHDIDSSIDCVGSNTFTFGKFGNLTTSGTGLKLQSEGRSFTIEIIAATGSLKCTEN